jgi:hypothetical protein
MNSKLERLTTIYTTIDMPIAIMEYAVPLSDFVANFVNILGKISQSIPAPLSFTR